VGRLNLEGDGQGDLAGHGGEQRAVFVYQIESYRYWQAQLKRTDFVFGQFSENFTIEGLADDHVCIGDRYRIGSAVFEVTQPRVTCYRVGIRMNEPRMPALLTSSGRPGFYMRVLEEGDVGAGDEILQVGQSDERMTVAEVNALLYSPAHPKEALTRALKLGALSPGWRSSFEALLKSPSSTVNGNAGLALPAAAHPAAPGFRPHTVVALERECADVLSITLERSDRQPVGAPLPGQYVVLRLRLAPQAPPVFRSYSLSGPPSRERYRISVKLEPHGVGGTYLHTRLRVGDALDLSEPRGSFVLEPGNGPVLLLSAGIGATPVVAMLHALAAARSARPVWWVHGSRDRQHQPFAVEVRQLVQGLPGAKSYVCYSRPGEGDKRGDDFDAAGHLSPVALGGLGIHPDTEAYLCGPVAFMREMRAALGALGLPPRQIHEELFNGSESITPGVVGAAARPPHLPQGDLAAGPVVSFARSGIAAHWNPSAYQSLLELAEACDVPVRWSCRTGVCHTCESGLVSGAVAYGPEPLDNPAAGNLLVCCSRPTGDVVVDL
jgi:ferredoxin-NADP reductase/MOSC domain-containing protein YiiM